LFGYTREELIGKPSIALVDPESEKSMEMEYRSTGELNEFEANLKRKDQHYIVLISSRRIEYNNSQCVLTVVKDVTKQRQTEKELEKYRQHLELLIKERTSELEKANTLLELEIIKQKESEHKVKTALEKEKELNELKTRFISTASHEFRTPLTTIYSSVQLLEKYGKTWDEEMYDNQFKRIKEYVKYMTKIMDDVLTISRADAGKIKFEPHKLDLKKFCETLSNDIKVMLLKNQSLKFSYKPKRKEFNLDEKLLKYSLLNLLSNAIKYSPSGGKITFNVYFEKNIIVFEVEDQGIGIPEKDQKFLFDPFHRAQNVNEINGTGLGMSIVKRSVEMHGGSISFNSKENHGSKFLIQIPIGVND